MLLTTLLLGCSMSSPPAVPYRPIHREGIGPGVEFGRMAGDGATVGLTGDWKPAERALREALLDGLAANGEVVVDGLGRFTASLFGNGQGVAVALRRSAEAHAALESGRPVQAAGPHGEVLSVIVAGTADAAVYVEGVGWFARKTMPGFTGTNPADGTPLVVPAKVALVLRAEPTFTSELLKRMQARR